MQKEVHGDHVPSFLFFIKSAIQNANIQPGVFLAKMKIHQTMSFFCLLSSYELLGYFPGFVVSKSLRIEVS